jgi:hypothetical protein
MQKEGLTTDTAFLVYFLWENQVVFAKWNTIISVSNFSPPILINCYNK